MSTLEYILKPPDGAGPGLPWFYRVGGTWSYLTGRDRSILLARGVPEFRDTQERYELVRKQVGV